MNAEQAFSLFGQLVAAGGGGAVVAYGIFRFLGKSWIEHELAKDLESAKSELGLLAARRLRLHDREYVVFPEIWAKLNKAVGSLGAAIMSYMEVPDFTRQSEQQTNDWLSRSDLSDEEKEFFRAQKDKIRGYSRILEWRRLVEARKDFVAFRTFFHENRIFISPEIKKKLDEIDDQMNDSWSAKKMDWEGYSRETGTSFMGQAHDTYSKQIKPLMLEIEGLVQAKLFPEQR